jgi:hypothetical protein
MVDSTSKEGTDSPLPFKEATGAAATTVDLTFEEEPASGKLKGVDSNFHLDEPLTIQSFAKTAFAIGGTSKNPYNPILAAVPYNPKLASSSALPSSKKGATKEASGKSKKKNTQKKKKKKKAPTKVGARMTVPPGLDKAPGEVMLESTFVGCRLHAVPVARLASYVESPDLKYYFSESTGFFYGGSCHGCGQWPPISDHALKQSKNHQSVHYCTQCTQDPACDGLPNMRYFLCDGCLLQKVGGGRRARKQINRDEY